MMHTATTLARKIRDKDLTSEELVSDHLERIGKINPRINAIVAFSEHALEQARAADQKLARGEPVGPLHGVPMTIKDCFDTAGIISTWGTLGRKDFVPEKDATIVRRLKEAGAILIGKTNTPEFTLNFSTWNKIHGFTLNPHDLTRSPGGSSGGAAAAIATGLTPFDIGTDFGGSVRVPSHFCGTVGIKPTSGSVPRTGLCMPPGMMLDFMSHIGPMARKVEDLKLLLPIIWGPDAIDTLIASVPCPASGTIKMAGLRCAIMTDNGIVTPSEETRAVVRAIGDTLAGAGMNVCEDRLDGVEETLAVAGGFWGVGAYVAVRQLIQAAGTRFEDIANNNFREPSFDGPEAAQQLETWRAQIDQISAEKHGAQMLRIENYRSRMLAHMARYDVLISPVTANPAPKLPKPGDHPFETDEASYTECFNLTGWPSGVVRGGTTNEGMPIGVQVTANPWREDIVLAVMEHLEDVLPDFAGPAISEN